MANAEVDSALRACKLIHSNSKDAAEKLRLYLDEAIKQKYGSSKTITNVLTKEMLDDLEHGSYSAPSSPLHDSRVSLIGNDAISPITATSPLAPILITDDKDIAVIEGDINLKDLLEEDLMCVVCRGINVTARNRLVECVECHSLYHQECHKPHVSEADVNDPRLVWYCATCKTERSPPAPGASSKASHKEVVSQEQSSKTCSSSTMSSSKGYSSGSSSKSSSGSKNTSSTSKSQTPPSSSSTSSTVKTISPIINIISVDKRLQNMKRKAAKQHESKRKHSK